MKYMWKQSEVKFVSPGPGFKRKVLARNEDMMTVYLEFEKGAGSIEDLHSHPHSQITYVIEGKFTFNVDGKLIEVSKGDSLINPPNLPHNAVCTEKGILLDVFSPNRPEQIPEDEKLDIDRK